MNREIPGRVKAEAALGVLRGVERTGQAARRLGVAEQEVRVWIDRFVSAGLEGFAGPLHPSSRPGALRSGPLRPDAPGSRARLEPLREQVRVLRAALADAHRELCRTPPPEGTAETSQTKPVALPLRTKPQVDAGCDASEG